jgi:uncharacterized protein (DUF1501 family)
MHASQKSSHSRRAFLRVGTIAGWSLASALKFGATARAGESSPRAKNVIMIFLTGGPATIDMWDMKPDAPIGIRGEFRPRETAVPGIQICEHMPRLAAAMKLATLVRSVSHTIAEHTQGTAYVMTGNRPTPAIDYPSLGSLSARLLESTSGAPPYLTLGAVATSGAGDLGGALNPFGIAAAREHSEEKRVNQLGLPSGFTVNDLERRQQVLARLDQRMRSRQAAELPQQLDRFQQQALEMLRSDKINQALDVSREPASVREQYGPSLLGRNALAARRLIEAGARFVTVGIGDWDTHANNFSRLSATLLPELDRGLAALLTDLDQRGLLQETIVYCTGEFGRTPGVNSAAGRDHWARSMTALLAGAGFRAGSVFGATDEEGGEPTADACSPDDLSATIFHQLGFSPEQQVLHRSGRPVALFRDGHVISGLVS